MADMDNAERFRTRIKSFVRDPCVWFATSLSALVILVIFANSIFSVLAVMAIAPSTLCLLIILALRAAVSRHWKRTAVAACLGIFSVALVYYTLRYGEQIRFAIMKPLYLARLHHEPNTTEEAWDWYAAFSNDISLFYLKDERMLPEVFSEGMEGCTVTVKKMSNHFFLIETNC